LGLAPGSIASEEIETFCKYSAFLKVIRYRSLEDEYTLPKTKQIGTCLFSSCFHCDACQSYRLDSTITYSCLFFKHLRTN
jgi:hypothetical protein